MPRKKETEKTETKQKKEAGKEIRKDGKPINKKELLEKAKELEKGIIEGKEDFKSLKKEVKFGEIEKKIENVRKKADTPELIVPLDEYVKAGIHLGTKVISGNMRQYVYRRRADGLAILNTNLIDEKLRTAISFISQYKPGEIILVCKRESGWEPAKKFSEVTGIRAFTKKYDAGIITNPNLEDFFEPSLLIICDQWLDKNAIHDATILNIPIVGLCDTNNLTRNLDLVVPCNNKSNKTLGLVLWILAQGFCKAKKIKFKSKINDFTGEAEETHSTKE